MEMTIFKIDPYYASVFFVLYIFISAVFGIAVYSLLRKPSMIRSEFRGLFQPVSNRTAIVWAIITFLPLSVYGYWDCWKYYYNIGLRDNKLIIRYYFPEREYAVSNFGDLKVTTESEVRKGIAYRIKLVTEGHVFISQQLTRNESEANLLVLNQEIQKHIGLTRE